VVLWICAHTPARITPNLFTLIGVIGSVVVFIGYLLSSRAAAFLWLASLGLVLQWFGDSLDGTLARFRHIERPRYGFFIDHSTDILAQLMFAFGLGLSSYVRFEIACLALIVYLIFSVMAFIRAQVTGVLEVASFGIGGTELRLALIVLNIAMFLVPPRPILSLWAPLALADLVVFGLAMLGFAAFLVALIVQARQFALEDPAPGPRR